MQKIKLAITDDDQLIAELLQSFLANFEEFEILYTAKEGTDLISKLEANADNIPDILLCDLRMVGMNGLDTIKHLKEHFPTIKIIVVSSFYQDSFVSFLFKNGASAYVPKGISPENLKEIILTVYHQGVYFNDEQLLNMRNAISSKTPKPALEEDHELSKREIDVLRLICMQKTAKEIGELLFISTKTVEGHKNNLFQKIGVKNVVGLVIYALQNNIIEKEDLTIL